MTADPHDPEPVRVAPDDVDGLGADGSGGAEENEVTHDVHLPGRPHPGRRGDLES